LDEEKKRDRGIKPVNIHGVGGVLTGGKSKEFHLVRKKKQEWERNIEERFL